jgi:hypothetical protein
MCDQFFFIPRVESQKCGVLLMWHIYNVASAITLLSEIFQSHDFIVSEKQVSIIQVKQFLFSFFFLNHTSVPYLWSL